MIFYFVQKVPKCSKKFKNQQLTNNFLFPFKGFDHADDIGTEVVIDGRERVGVRGTVTIDRSTEEMSDGIGDKELTGGGCVAFQIEENTIHIRFGMAVSAFRDGIGKRGISVNKLEGIVGQFAEVVSYGFVGAVDGSIEEGVIEVDPIGFIHVGTGFNDRVLRQVEGIGVCRVLRFESYVRGIRRGDTEVAVGFRDTCF